MKNSLPEVGMNVDVTGLMPGERTTIQIVADRMVNYSRHELPRNSVLGRLLVGRNVGDKVVIETWGAPREMVVRKINFVE
jgi:transcription elongation GreA/GreB family factor